MSTGVEITAVVPVVKLVDTSGDLVREYMRTLDGINSNFELIYVLDGEHTDLIDQLRELANSDSRLRVIQLAKNFGEASALTAGFSKARGEKVLTLPAYAQVELSEIARLLDELSECDLAVGTRTPSHLSTGFHRLRRKAFHWLVRVSTGQTFSDMGCGVRAMKKEVTTELLLYGDQYRFFLIAGHQARV